MFCTKCGANLTEGTQFCTVCGSPVGAAPPQSSAPYAAPAQPAPPQFAPPAAPGYLPPVAPASYARPSVDYAGFWLRFVAFLIDFFVWGIPIVFAVMLMAGMMGVAGAFKHLEPGESPDDVFALLGVGFILLACFLMIIGRWLYYAAFESSGWQGTLGKKALGLYVTDLNGNRLTFGRATGRFFARLVTGLIPLEIGYIMAGFTEKKQALHDMIAGCLVLRRL